MSSRLDWLKGGVEFESRECTELLAVMEDLCWDEEIRCGWSGYRRETAMRAKMNSNYMAARVAGRWAGRRTIDEQSGSDSGETILLLYGFPDLGCESRKFEAGKPERLPVEC